MPQLWRQFIYSCYYCLCQLFRLLYNYLADQLQSSKVERVWKMCVKIPSKECSNSLIHISHYFLLISHLLSGPVQLIWCWDTPRSMHGDGDICTSAISHPVLLNPSLPPVWIKPGHSLLSLEYTLLILSVSTCWIITLSFKMSLKRNSLKAVFFWMCYSWLFGVAHRVCPLFIQAVCTEEAGVSAHAALPLQECRAKESWRERNGTHAERLNHCSFWKRTKGQRWARAVDIPLTL